MDIFCDVSNFLIYTDIFLNLDFNVAIIEILIA